MCRNVTRNKSYAKATGLVLTTVNFNITYFLYEETEVVVTDTLMVMTFHDW